MVTIIVKMAGKEAGRVQFKGKTKPINKLQIEDV
jgi:hypothetical protein